MPMTTEGGSGNGSVALPQFGKVTQTLFTTPNTANATFIVTVTWAADTSNVGSGAAATIGGWGQLTGSTTNSSPLVIKIGPNSPVQLTWEDTTGLTNTSIYYSYNYVGVVIT
jgi:hypothetical protein